MNSPRQPHDWQAHYLIPIMLLPNQSIHYGVLKVKRKGNLLHENDQAGHWKTHFKDRWGWVSEFDLLLSRTADRVQCQEKPWCSSSVSDLTPQRTAKVADARQIVRSSSLKQPGGKKRRRNTCSLPAAKKQHSVRKWSQREEAQEENDRGQHLHQIHALHWEGNHTFQACSLTSHWG